MQSASPYSPFAAAPVNLYVALAAWADVEVGMTKSCELLYLLGQGGRRPGQQQLQRAVLDLLQQRRHAQAPLTACRQSLLTG